MRDWEWLLHSQLRDCLSHKLAFPALSFAQQGREQSLGGISSVLYFVHARNYARTQPAASKGNGHSTSLITTFSWHTKLASESFEPTFYNACCSTHFLSLLLSCYASARPFQFTTQVVIRKDFRRARWLPPRLRFRLTVVRQADIEKRLHVQAARNPTQKRKLRRLRRRYLQQATSKWRSEPILNLKGWFGPAAEMVDGSKAVLPWLCYC